MSTSSVPSPHEFADPEYVHWWVQYNELKYPYRRQLFDAFAAQVAQLGADLSVLELGSGSGELAEHLLTHCSVSNYYLVDLSLPMHDLARHRLAAYSDRTHFVVADFRSPSWVTTAGVTAGVAVSMQAIHELRHRDRTPELYHQLQRTVRAEGAVLICDHLRQPDDESPLYMSVDEHLAAMNAAGLVDATPILVHPRMILVRARVGTPC